MELIEREAAVKLLLSLGSRDYRREKGTICEAVKVISDPEYTPTIAPIRAAGGCRCGECKNYVDAYGTGKMMCMRPIRSDDYSETGCIYPLELDTKETDFCSYGEPMEA